MSDPQEVEVIEPNKIAGGRFALYGTPKGGLHLRLDVDGETEPRHVEIPAFALKMMANNPLASFLGG